MSIRDGFQSGITSPCSGLLSDVVIADEAGRVLHLIHSDYVGFRGQKGKAQVTGTAVETFRGVAYPWLCDSMGHMNTQHYCALFDGASFHFLALISQIRAKDRGWADVKQTTEYKKEVRAGDLLIIRTKMIRLGRSSLTYCHTMSDVESGELRATSEHVVAHFDLANRISVPLTNEIATSARRYIHDDTNAN